MTPLISKSISAAIRRAFGVGLILLVAVLHAETATVLGTITQKNNKPAVNVLVLIGGKSRYTDVGGRYRIDGVPMGRQKMQVTRGGKVLLEAEVDIHEAVSVVNQKLP